MYKIPASTLFLGKNLVSVPECHSTNTLVAELASKTETPEGTLVITDHQTAGRGQRGNSWQTHRGQNFTFSFLLKPKFLPVKDQFFLNCFVSLGLTDYLQTYFDSEDVKVKWPNDILVQRKKICGVLIENQLSRSQLSQSVVGIGLNVNQSEFEIPTASSMAILGGNAFDLKIEFEKLLVHLERRYLQLKQNKTDQLKADYLQRMYWFNELHLFSSFEKEFEGKITGVDEFGRLQMECSTGVRTFDVKEVSYLN